jgi:hypothetical protein
MSGPPWGSTFLRPVAVCGGMGASSTMQGERMAVNDGVLDTAWTTFGPWVFWNRPHAVLPGPLLAPYDRLYLSCRAVVASGGDVTLSVRCSTIDLSSGDVIAQSTATTTVTTTEANEFGAGTDAFFGALGSGHVACVAEFKHNGSGQTVNIPAVSLLCTVKRSH